MDKEPKIQFSTIDQYLAAQPAEVRDILQQLREIIKKAAPEAQEVISYQIPAFRLHGTVVCFAGFKNHYGLYPFPDTIEFFREKLAGYELSKGTIRFPLDKPIPAKLITEIVKHRVKENLAKNALTKSVKVAKAGK